MARRAIRAAGPVRRRERFAEKLRRGARLPQLRAEEVLQAADESTSRRRSTKRWRSAPRLQPLVADVPRALYDANRAGKNLLFEGAQGSLLDIDHGTYPFVTSSQLRGRRRRRRAPASGRTHLHYVLGITKAYARASAAGRSRPSCPTSRRAAAPARHTSSAPPPAGRGASAGSTPRRCKRSIQLNGVSGLCITKLDVLDGVEAVKICVGYELRRRACATSCRSAPRSSSAASRSTRSCRAGRKAPSASEFDGLPRARAPYLGASRSCAGVPIDIISTGPDRDETIVLRHPFDA